MIVEMLDFCFERENNNKIYLTKNYSPLKRFKIIDFTPRVPDVWILKKTKFPEQ